MSEGWREEGNPSFGRVRAREGGARAKREGGRGPSEEGGREGWREPELRSRPSLPPSLPSPSPPSPSLPPPLPPSLPSLPSPLPPERSQVTSLVCTIKLQHPLSVCVSVPPTPFFSTRPVDRNQIWHTYSGRYGTHSQLKKIEPPHPRRVPWEFLGGQKIKSPGNVMNCPENPPVGGWKF